jgi:hypothetical protein
MQMPVEGGGGDGFGGGGPGGTATGVVLPQMMKPP